MRILIADSNIDHKKLPIEVIESEGTWLGRPETLPKQGDSSDDLASILSSWTSLRCEWVKKEGQARSWVLTHVWVISLAGMGSDADTDIANSLGVIERVAKSLNLDALIK